MAHLYCLSSLYIDHIVFVILSSIINIVEGDQVMVVLRPAGHEKWGNGVCIAEADDRRMAVTDNISKGLWIFDRNGKYMLHNTSDIL